MLFYVIIKIIPAIAVTALVFGLLYIRSSPRQMDARLKRTAQKYAKMPQYHDFFRNIYKPRFLMSWSVMALIFLLSIALDIHQGTHDVRVIVLYLVSIIVLAGITAAIYVKVTKPKG